MKPGSVIVDVAVDQGGCVETTRPTSHSDPVFVEEEVVHYCVTNMPGALGRTSTFASVQRDVALGYDYRLAKELSNPHGNAQSLRDAVNIHDGKITNQPVAETFNFKFQPMF